VSAEEAAKFCPSCGRENAESNRFCPACGTLLVLEAAAPVKPEPAPAPKPEPVRPPDPKVLAMPPEARETELQRLLTRANVERMRALIVPAKKTLDDALSLARLVGPIALAQVQEQRGDLFAMEERWADAKSCYAEAKSADPSRAVAEKKYAEMAVKIADEQAFSRLGDMMLRGDSLGEILTDPRAGKRNGFLAALSSMLVPGLGQMLAGQLLKGGIFMGLWLICLAFISLSGEREAFVGFITSVFNPGAAKGLPKQIGPLTWFALGGIALTWLVAVFEAPFSASKTETLRAASGEIIDKSGWEP
jgi:hypothetical protein